ncbi:MAG TPA: hypothetical protein VJ723_16210, partial [Candidatus Angelobacter sp.]|nr:hypothetical protein [Candidatus Angelobacter sp.]
MSGWLESGKSAITCGLYCKAASPGFQLCLQPAYESFLRRPWVIQCRNVEGTNGEECDTEK